MPTPATHKKWGKAVATERLRMKWSTLDLAVKVGVNPTSIWRFESGKCAPSDETRVRLAAAFGKPAHELFPYPSLRQLEAEKRTKATPVRDRVA